MITRKWLYPLLTVPILGAIVLGFLLQQHVLIPGHAAAARLTLPQDSKPFVKNSTLLSSTTGSQKLTVAVGLNTRNSDELEQYAKDVSDPNSPLYRHYVSAETYNALFAPTIQDEASVVNFLKSQGLSIDQTYSNRLLVVASGPVDTVQQAFGTRINNYQTPRGRRFYANSSAPTVPADVASKILTVSGLDNYAQYRHSSSGVKPRALTGSAANTCPAGGNGPNNTASYIPRQIAKAYNLTDLYDQGFHGEGQTIGLIEMSGYNRADLPTFTNCYGGGSTDIQDIYLNKFDGGDKTGAGEVTLDMDVVLGLTPRLSTLKVYMGANDASNTANWNAVWNKAISDRISVISNSWGSCESVDDANFSQAKLENTYFQTAAVQGQTILSAAGDNGSTDCNDDKNNIIDQISVDDPASQPYMTGVGGTQLRLDEDGSIASERVWNEKNHRSSDGSVAPNGATGGGVSSHWPKPRWQKAPGTLGANREVPDISLDADPQTGYVIYCNAGDCQKGGWLVFGGTSAAAPAWASIVSLTNQSLANTGDVAQLGFLNPSLYALASDPTIYASVFHDIVKTGTQTATSDPGNNDYLGKHKGMYPTTPGYDRTTGLGTVNAGNFAIQMLKIKQITPTNAIPPANKSWYFAEGFVNPTYRESLALLNPNEQAVNVTINYLLQQPFKSFSKSYTLVAHSRNTVNVHEELKNGPYHYDYTRNSYSVSTMVISDQPVVAERSMFFHAGGNIDSGTGAMGVTRPATDYYFANVQQGNGYSSFFAILNPSTTQKANVTASYYRNGQLVKNVSVSAVGPQHRGTHSPGDVKLTGRYAVQVHSDIPTVIERPTYFNTTQPDVGKVTGAASVIGSQAPGTDWLFAEGSTQAGFHEDVSLANFGSASATATVTLEFGNGSTQQVHVPVAANAQSVVDVNALVKNNKGDVSAEITSDQPIVAQRQIYFNHGGIIGGTDAMGFVAPARSSYSFAEGNASSGFNEFLTLQNPTASEQTVVYTLYMQKGITLQKFVVLKPQSRTTVGIKPPSGAGAESSVSLYALNNGTVVAERAQYFKYQLSSKILATGGVAVAGYSN